MCILAITARSVSDGDRPKEHLHEKNLFKVTRFFANTLKKLQNS